MRLADVVLVGGKIGGVTHLRSFRLKKICPLKCQGAATRICPFFEGGRAQQAHHLRGLYGSGSSPSMPRRTCECQSLGN